jgi:SpoVK/Ycf46/Vps4 family AAA+-type ATPase
MCKKRKINNTNDSNNDNENKKKRRKNKNEKSNKNNKDSNKDSNKNNEDPNKNSVPKIDIIRIIPKMQPFPIYPDNDIPKYESYKYESDEENFFNENDYDIILKKEINKIDDLIELGKLYDPENPKKIKYNINVKQLYKLIEPLNELKNMIGMKKVKNHIIDLILYYLQDFEKYNKNIMHTVLYGPPGCGKTELAHILAKIYYKMGIIKTNNVNIVKRSDLIGEYCGHTAIQTQNAIDKAKDGVLLIDEAYSLGNIEQKDSFTKECIDTINQNLTENKSNFICIIAGYKEALDSCFFAYNQGLERRFPFRFTVDKYNANDLRDIYIKMIYDDNWMIEEPIQKNIPINFFEENRDIFKYNGGDMENLFHMTKIAHSRRVFCFLKKDKKKNYI